MNLLRNNKGDKIFSIFVLILMIGLTTLILSKKKESSVGSIVSSPEMFNHPIYSKYDFTRNDSLINIGIQPLYMPVGIVFEVIKRDNILNNALSTLGKSIEYYSFLKGADVNFYMQNKKLDGGTGGDMPALKVSSAFDVVIPAIIQKGNASVVSNRPMLTNDLKGKRIAYPYGSISHYYILKLLHSNGITEEMVRLIPMELTTMAKALDNNEIDLFCAWEPNVASALKQYPDFFIIHKRITTGYLFFTKTFVEKNPKIANHFLAAFIRSVSWLKSDRHNLLLACEWNIREMEKLTGEKSILNAKEISYLALKDILQFTYYNSIVIDTDNISTNSALCDEYKFLASFDPSMEIDTWEHLAKSFDNDMIIDILEHPEKFQLYEYDYFNK